MIIKYTPEDGAAQEWAYAPLKVRQSEAEMIEKRSGMEWDAFNKALLSGNARARKVVLWHCLRKDHPIFRWEDVPDFAMSEVQIEFDAKELGDIRAAVEKSKDMADDIKSEALRVLDEQLSELPVDEGKAPLSDSDSVTAG